MTGSLLVLVTGSRTWTDRETVHAALLDTWHDALQDGHPGITVVHGAAPGADSIADQWARHHQQHGVERDPRPADWEGPCGAYCQPGHRKARRDGTSYCPFAGHRRNQQMIDLGPAVVLAFQRDGSTGTADCIRRAETAGLPVRRWTT